MIKDVGGRWKSFRTSEEIIKLFEKDYDSLSSEDKEIFNSIIRDFRVEGKSALFESISSSTYRIRPCSMDSFLNDQYYLGEVSKSIFPAWKEELIKIFSNRYEEVILGGSLGAGKTLIAVIALIRMIYEVSCLKDPHDAYQVSPSDKIVFPILSITEHVANEAFERLGQIVSKSQYFQDHFRPKITQDNGILFPNQILVPPPASNIQSTLGGNTFGAMIDESNFFKVIQKGSIQVDYMNDLYKSIKTRIRNRFIKNGRVPGMLIIVSSKAGTDSFTEKRIREAVNDPLVYVVEKSSYEVQPKERYSEKKFRVAIGTEMFQSKILEDNEDVPEGVNIIEVPEDLRTDFERDIDAAIRDVSGYATVAVTPFIQNRKKLHAAINPKSEHPCNHFIWKQDEPLEIHWNKIANRSQDGSFSPKINPGIPRFAHLDLSKSGDRTGISIGHINGWREVKKGLSSEYSPNYIVDFMLAIQAPKGREIVYSDIRKLIYQFSAHGFFIKQVSADQYQSAAILQILEQQGYRTKIISVDKVGPYDTFKQVLYDECLSYYRHDLFLSETMKLEKNWKTGKVDHPHNGSKDLSDSVCGIVQAMHDEASTMSPSIGVEVGRSDILDNNDESWVIDGAIAVEKKHKDNNNGDWKSEVEQKNTQQSFTMPFLIG